VLLLLAFPGFSSLRHVLFRVLTMLGLAFRLDRHSSATPTPAATDGYGLGFTALVPTHAWTPDGVADGDMAFIAKSHLTLQHSF